MEAATAQTQAALAQLPMCIKAPTLQAIAASNCGLDVPCLCQNDGFLTTLQGAVLKECHSTDRITAMSMAKDLCTSAVPSLEDNQTTYVVSSLSIIMTVMVLSVVLRLVSRHLSAARFGPDDYTIIAAMVTTLGFTTTSILIVRYGFGQHTITLSLEDVVSFQKCYFAIQLMFPTTMSFAKISMLFLYRRIFPSKGFNTILYIIGSVILAWWLASVLSITFVCHPVQYFWDKTIPGGHCGNDAGILYGVAGPNIATDIAVLILPLPILWRLQMPLARKLAITAIFMLGSFVCVASFIRLPFLAEIEQGDITWNIVKAAIWINVECNIGIVCSNLPLLRPIINVAFPPSLRSAISRSRPSLGFSSRRKRSPSYRLSDEEDRFASSGSGGSNGKGEKQTVRAKIEPVSPRRTHTNWFSRQESFDEGEEMVPVRGGQ